MILLDSILSVASLLDADEQKKASWHQMDRPSPKVFNLNHSKITIMNY